MSSALRGASVEQDENSCETLVVIPTRNRCQELDITLRSVLAQKDVSLEVVVWDDGSTDGTSEMVESRFKDVRLLRGQSNLGPWAARNRCVFASGVPSDYLLSLDDDCYFTDPYSLARATSFLRSAPDCHCLALRYIEPMNPRNKMAKKEVQKARTEPMQSFVACAALMRRSSFEAVGGYFDHFGVGHGEADLARKFFRRGWLIEYFDAGEPLVHLKSPRRDAAAYMSSATMRRYIVDILHLPLPIVLAKMPLTFLSLMFYRARPRDLPQRLLWNVHGIGAALLRWRLRDPMGVRDFLRYQQLPLHGPEQWDERPPQPCGLSQPLQAHSPDVYRQLLLCAPQP